MFAPLTVAVNFSHIFLSKSFLDFLEVLIILERLQLIWIQLRLFLSIFMSVSRNEHLRCISSRLPWDPVSYSDISPTSLGW